MKQKVEEYKLKKSSAIKDGRTSRSPEKSQPKEQSEKKDDAEEGN